MKYIDADKLIAEIKAWRNKQMGFARDAVNEALKIIDSLQQEQPEGLDEAANDYARMETKDGSPYISIEAKAAFLAGAEWVAGQGVTDAIEGEICGRVRDHINVKFQDGVGSLLTPAGVSHIPADVSKYNIGDKVVVQIRKNS